MSKQPGTTTLVDRYRNGDKNAAGQLIVHWFKRMEDSARRRLRGFRVVQKFYHTSDLVQITSMRILKALTKPAPEPILQSSEHWRRFMRWHLYKRLLDMAKACKRRNVIHPPHVENKADGFEDLHEAFTLEEMEFLHELAQQLPKPLKDVFECRYYLGLTVKQTADKLNISERTVKRRWEAAIAWLRKHLGEN